MKREKRYEKIEELLLCGDLSQVPGNKKGASRLLAQARSHVRTAHKISGRDPEIAYNALYAAARKALTALLLQQGLQLTRADGHKTAAVVAHAQLVPPLGDVRHALGRIKRCRDISESADFEDQRYEAIYADLSTVTDVVDAVGQLLPELTVFVPRF